MNIFNLPDLGEGLPDAEIAEWHVKIGDKIKVDEPLVAMETAKAVVEVPSPQAGEVKKLYGKPGDIIKTGDPLVEFLLANSVKTSKKEDTGTVAGKIEVGNTVLKESATGVTVKNGSKTKVKATPAVRALARKLSVDLSLVSATGANQTITAKDVQGYANNSSSESDDFEPLTGVRRSMAQAMTQAHKTVAPVTIMDDAILLNWSEKEDITARVIKAIVAGVKEEPSLNAWFGTSSLSRKLISSIDLGIACDTADGLFVPVIKNVEKLSLTDIRKEVDQIKKGVNNRSLTPEQLRGATFTLSNFGKFAGRYANPVVVPPQVAILGTGAIREEVVAVNGKTEISRVLPLSLTFDHRACRGGEATRFLGAVIKELTS